MVALYILIVFVIILLWFFLSPSFSKIGKWLSNLLKSVTTEDIENNEDKEKQNEE